MSMLSFAAAVGWVGLSSVSLRLLSKISPSAASCSFSAFTFSHLIVYRSPPKMELIRVARKCGAARSVDIVFESSFLPLVCVSFCTLIRRHGLSALRNKFLYVDLFVVCKLCGLTASGRQSTNNKSCKFRKINCRIYQNVSPTENRMLPMHADAVFIQD